MKKNIAIILFVLMMVCLVSGMSIASEDSEETFDFDKPVSANDVVDKMDDAVGLWIFKILPVVSILFMSIGGVTLMAGKSEGKERIGQVVLGVGVACLAPAIIMYLVNLFKGLY